MLALDEEDDEPVESRQPVVGRRHRGASDRLLGRARRLTLDPDEAMALAETPTSVGDTIRQRLHNMGADYADAVVAMWVHLYAGGPSPIGSLRTADAERTWAKWFESEGLAPKGIGAVREERSPSPFAYRDALEPPTAPVERSGQPTAIDRAWSDAQAQQAALVDAWRAKQIAELRRLWADGFQEGVANFAEQYPELATEELLAELDAEEASDEHLGPHYASVGKMVGQLTNLLMLAPAPSAIASWFDQNAHRVQQQAETMAWQAEQKGYQQAGADFGLEIDWESEGDERVCDDCAALEAGGPYTAEGGDNPLPALPGDGSTQCGPNCRCSLNYREPDQAGLAQAEVPELASAGSDQVASSEALFGALGVQDVTDLEEGSVVSTFDEIASRTRHLDVEAGFALGKNGDILVSALGNADSLDFTPYELQRTGGAEMIVHNHPLSVSFSPTDVAFAYARGVGEMRVVSPLWDYSLKPIGSHFLASDGAKAIDAAQAQVEKLYPAVKQAATDAYHAQFSTPGAEHLSYAEHFRLASANFWHDVWTQTAKDSGLFKYERTPAPKLAQMVHVRPAHVGGSPGLQAGKTPLPFDSWLDDLRSRYSVEIEMSRRDLDGKNDLWTLSKIVVPKAERSSGVGSAVMKEIVQRADQVGATLALTPSNAFGGSVGRLRTFYARFGFAKNTGPSRDLRISEALVRAPKGGVSFPTLQEAKIAPLGQMPLWFPKTEQDLLAMEKGTGPTGSNEGWWLHDKQGISYYVKPMDLEHATNEVGAMRVYEAMGAIPGKDVPYVNVIKRVDDKPVVVSRAVEELEQHSSSWWDGPTLGAEAAKTDARRFWAVDALLSHYDVVGMVNDNLLEHGIGGAFRVEAGGAMKFRAQGALKNDWKVGAPWSEPWTMRGITKDGVFPMSTIKPVFGGISNEQAANLLGQLDKKLGLDSLALAWKDLGMSSSDIVDNLAVINSRLKQIPTIQEQLGMVKPSAHAGEIVALQKGPIAPPPALASKVTYTKWDFHADKYGKALAVQLKPFFEDFKAFSPIAGKPSTIIENLAHGMTFPPHAIAQGEAKIARLKLRVAFARSYNLALAGKLDAQYMPAAVAEFWKSKLGLVETKSVDVPHVISTWIPKPKDELPVKTVTTALPVWKPESDPGGVNFYQAHLDWFGALGDDQTGAFEEMMKLPGEGWGKAAASYNLYLGMPHYLETNSPKLFEFWKAKLGDLPAQPAAKLELLKPTVAKEQAIDAAQAGPYDQDFLGAKDDISTGQDAEDVLNHLGEQFFGYEQTADTNEVINGLVKFGLAGDEASAANQVAEWMAKYQDAAIEKGVVWATPDADAYAQFKQDFPSGVGIPTLKDFEETYADWVTGGDQASWMPTPVTKWFDANMAKPKPAPIIAQHIGKPSLDFVKDWDASLVPGGGSLLDQEFLDKAWDLYNKGGLTPHSSWWDAFQGWTQHKIETVEPLGIDALKAAWTFNQPIEPWYEAWTSGKPMAGTEAPIKPDSPAGLFFVQHGVPPGEPPFEPSPEAMFGQHWAAMQDSLESVDKEEAMASIWKHIYEGGPLPTLGGAPITPGTLGTWKSWFEEHSLTPENATLTKEEEAVVAAQLPDASAEQSTVSFTKQTTLLAWSPTNDKWAKQFGKAHPKLYTSFASVFKGAQWTKDLTADLKFPAYALKNPVKVERLRLKVAMARTYNLAVQGKTAELAALNPKLPAFWQSKLGEFGAKIKPVGPIDATLANLVAVRDELKTTHSPWYPDFRGQFGHSITLKIVPELASAPIDIPASSTRERELRALAYAKSYLMAKAGDVAGLKAIDEKLLYFWDDKLGGNLVPRVAVSLQGAPWIHDLNALYGHPPNTQAITQKYERSTRAADFGHFQRGIGRFTGSSNVELRNAGVSVLKGGTGGGVAGKQAKAMLEAIQDAPATAPALTRSESWTSVAQRAGVTRADLASFLRRKIGTDYTFQMDMVSSQYTGHWSGDLKWHIEKGSKAIYAEPFSSHPNEHEYIIAGRFQILRVEEGGDGGLHVYVRQVGVFDLPD